jgi:GNAT superfamily N-acetyltransferase
VSAVVTDQLGPDALDGIAELCRQALGPGTPERGDLAASLFGGPEPAVVRGDPERGVVASAVRQGQGFIRLLAVHPRHRRQGVGHGLLTAAELDLAHCPSVTVGTDAPDYLFPGVDSRLTAMQCLLEAHHYYRSGVNLNMDVDLTVLPEDPGGPFLATAADRDEVREWTDRHWAHWTAEVLAALGKDRLLLARDEEGITGFCAWDVTRSGWLGPVAVRPGLIGRRTGVPLLLGALHRMRADGRNRAEIAWISPVRFYARTVGAVMGTAYLVHRKDTPDPPADPGAHS